MRRQATCLVLSMLFAAKIGSAADIEVSLWPVGNVESLPGVVSVEDGPCGSVARVRLSRLPPLDSIPLKPERVVEIDAAGQVIRRWATPVDTYPVALDGKALIVGFNGRVYYKVGADRHIQLIAGLPAPDTKFEGSERTCPKLPEFGKSAYARCWGFRDLKTQREHILMFEGVCS